MVVWSITPLLPIEGHADSFADVMNIRICRDPRFGMSQVSWRRSVAHHPTEDNSHAAVQAPTV